MDSRFDPKKEDLRRFQTGPIGPHLAGFASQISDQGYLRRGALEKIRVSSEFSQWLAHQRVPLLHLDEQQVTRFFAGRRTRWLKESGQRALKRLLQYLREREIIPPEKPPPPTEIERVILKYEQYLTHERGLRANSVSNQRLPVERFLSWLFPTGEVCWARLSPKAVVEYVSHCVSSHCGPQLIEATTCYLRSLFRFLYLDGQIASNLSTAVPKVARWRHIELPQYLQDHQVEKVLRSCDRRRKIGKRDYAILLLLARLGLRGVEVTKLNLADVDWRSGTILIRGKGPRFDRMPLPQDVGEAIADYVRHARPKCSSESFFITCRAPHTGFTKDPANAVPAIVRQALLRAGVATSRRGAHVFRHSLATRMLRNGASLHQIAEVLRHQDIQTTEKYAKVDLKALRALALPWPGGAR